MQPILNLNMPSEITTDVDFFYNFLVLHPARQDLRRHWGALSRFKLLLFVLFFLYFTRFSIIFNQKKTSKNFRKIVILLNVFP